MSSSVSTGDSLSRFKRVVHGKLMGCTESEIRHLEAARGRVPVDYANFLRLAGKSAGNFMTGSDFHYAVVASELTESARLMMEELGVPPIPTNALVFFGHQDYQFFWFLTGDAEGSTVFRFMDGDREPSRIAPSFSEWLDGALTQHEEEARPRGR